MDDRPPDTEPDWIAMAAPCAVTGEHCVCRTEGGESCCWCQDGWEHCVGEED